MLRPAVPPNRRPRASEVSPTHTWNLRKALLGRPPAPARAGAAWSF